MSTKKLLDAQNVDDIIDSVNISQEVFANDKGEAIKYNKLIITFENGDQVSLKPTDELKMAIYYARKEVVSSK